MFTNWDL